jgi:hypothetical protein
MDEETLIKLFFWSMFRPGQSASPEDIQTNVVSISALIFPSDEPSWLCFVP